jgi:hypothetical protein
MVEIVVKLRPDVAAAMQSGTTEPAEAELRKTLDDLGVSLEPVHPGFDDSLLAPYFRVEVDDPEAADRVITSLQQSEVVEAAYVKPADEPP